MTGIRKPAAAVAAMVIALTLLAAVPVVSYSTPFSMSAASTSSPIHVNGRASVLYAVTGLGTGPYPPLLLVTQGNSSALLHFAGQRLAYWEGPFTPDTEVNPGGLVAVTGLSITQQAFGLLNFSATLSNIGDRPIANLSVVFHYPSYGTNQTVAGFTRSIAPIARCASVLQPSKSCVASLSLPQSPSLLTDEYYAMQVEAWGRGVTSDKTGYAPPFVYAYSQQVRYTGAGLSTQWVESFIKAVNRQRNASALAENRTLDEFAAFRYDSLRAEYQISDFNFSADYARFFGPSGPGVLEEILYPGGVSPAAFLTYLQKHAPGHWSGLMDPTYRQYGYFFGTGPAVEVGPGCSTDEVPGPNINITAWVVSHGCSYVIADEIWFIIILGS